MFERVPIAEIEGNPNGDLGVFVDPSHYTSIEKLIDAPFYMDQLPKHRDAKIEWICKSDASEAIGELKKLDREPNVEILAYTGRQKANFTYFIVSYRNRKPLTNIRRIYERAERKRHY